MAARRDTVVAAAAALFDAVVATVRVVDVPAFFAEWVHAPVVTWTAASRSTDIPAMRDVQNHLEALGILAHGAELWTCLMRAYEGLAKGEQCALQSGASRQGAPA